METVTFPILRRGDMRRSALPMSAAWALLAPIGAGTAPVVVDVRTRREYDSGHVPGAIHIPFYSLLARQAEIPGSRDEPVVVYCERGPRSLRQEVSDGDLTGRERQGNEHGRGCQHPDRSVPPSIHRGSVRLRLAVHLQHTIDEVHDPVVIDPRPRVEAALAFAIELEARLRDLHGERHSRRVRFTIVSRAALDHDEVRFRLGFVIERDG